MRRLWSYRLKADSISRCRKRELIYAAFGGAKTVKKVRNFFSVFVGLRVGHGTG